MKKIRKIKPTKLSKKKEKEKVYNSASEIYSEWFENYYDEFEELLHAKKISLVTNSSL